MRKKILAALAIIGILVLLTLPMATPVMAAEVGLSKTYHEAGMPTHPTDVNGSQLDVFLLGMQIDFNLAVRNESATLNVTDMIVSDIEPGGYPKVPVAFGVNLKPEGNGASSNWSGTYLYTLPSIISGKGIQYDPSPPAGLPPHYVVNTLATDGQQGIETFNLTLTKTAFIATPSIQVIKTPDKALAKPGDVVTYNLTVINNGDWPLTKKSVTDNLTGDLTANFSDLDAGASQSIFIPYTVQAGDPSTLTNNFTATYTATGFDPTLTGATVSSSAIANVTIVHPDYTLVKTANPTVGTVGTLITYYVTITNTGDVQLDLVSASDALSPPNDTTPHDKTGLFPAHLAASGGTATISYQRAIGAGDTSPIDNTITTIYQVHGLTNQLMKPASAEVTIPESPHTAIQTVTSSVYQVSPSGTDVTITVSDKNTSTTIVLGNPSMWLVIDPPGIGHVLMAQDTVPWDSGDLNHSGTMDPGEVWVWKYTDYGVTVPTTFYVAGHAQYQGEDFTEQTENGQVSVTVTSTPASSNLTIGIMIVGFAGVITFFTLRRRRRSHLRS